MIQNVFQVHRPLEINLKNKIADGRYAQETRSESSC